MSSGRISNPYFVRYPEFRKKALTLSYDDGVIQDRRLIDIMNRHGIRGSFNLNSIFYTADDPFSSRRRLGKEDALNLYANSGHEIAVHGYLHSFLEQLPAGNAAWEIVRDRETLESMFGTMIRGMAYPQGTYSDDLVATLRQCGIAYARICTPSFGFDLPKDWLRLQPTCHHRVPELPELCEKFLTMDVRWNSKLFYLWGHSYEFDDNNNWEIIEEFCKTMGGHSSIWYCTTIELYDYLEAAHRIQSSVNGSILYNPTAVTLYLETTIGSKELKPGETLHLPTR